MNKVLLVMPFFNSYHKKIKKEIEELGYEVQVVRDSSTFVKIIHLKFISKKLYFLYMQVIWPLIFKFKTRRKYDYLFVIKGEELTPHLCKHLLANCVSQKSVLYLWDSIAHNPRTSEVLKYFTFCFTFDDDDSKNEKYRFELFPLFYSEEFSSSKVYKKAEAQYDFMCIGSFKEERADFLRSIESKFEPHNYRYLFKLYLPWNQYIRKLVSQPDFYPKYGKYIFVRKMALSTVAEITHNSKVVVDVPDKIQSGLTMRTFEALGAHKKLLTTNYNVKNYSFYLPENIKVNLNDMTDDFITSSYVNHGDVTELRSIKNWVASIMNKLNS
ncbi:hypothetical protein M979_1980 [Buttiauxella noackiae ATCC 51607]|uniref:Uncharacterized protein n=1 Tax=Buttiauxella noackiae ATCC 51607 TaxID=1354255 RepID=A0A1B7HQF2_9ENTR|nr:hypothetical protein [Buttiauxella noackiae]OAT17846.1 hypothetical protein M979_1980 [Buttiauxella noackiae ATCC 51607]